MTGPDPAVVAAVQDLQRKVLAAGGASVTLNNGLADLGISAAALADLVTGAPAAGQPHVELSIRDVTDRSATATWKTDEHVTGWTVGRDKVDRLGSPPWSTRLAAAVRQQVFGLLLPDTTYRITLTPDGADPVTVDFTTADDPAAPPPPDPGALHGPRALADDWVRDLVDRDDFTGPGVDTTRWAVYHSAGHNGKGLRRASAFSIVDADWALGGRALRVAGTPDGTTGGMAHRLDQRFGRWSARVMVPDRTPAGDLTDERFHPLVLTWPERENWARGGGEIDFVEGKCRVDRVETFLHYGPARNGSTAQTSGHIDVPVDRPHWFEMEWTPDRVTVWCDGERYFEDRDRSHFNYPEFGRHHGCIQLDWFPDDRSSLPRRGPGEMLVDVYCTYRHPATQ